MKSRSQNLVEVVEKSWNGLLPKVPATHQLQLICLLNGISLPVGRLQYLETDLLLITTTGKQWQRKMIVAPVEAASFVFQTGVLKEGKARIVVGFGKGQT